MTLRLFQNTQKAARAGARPHRGAEGGAKPLIQEDGA